MNRVWQTLPVLVTGREVRFAAWRRLRCVADGHREFCVPDGLLPLLDRWDVEDWDWSWTQRSLRELQRLNGRRR